MKLMKLRCTWSTITILIHVMNKYEKFAGWIDMVELWVCGLHLNAKCARCECACATVHFHLNMRWHLGRLLQITIINAFSLSSLFSVSVSLGINSIEPRVSDCTMRLNWTNINGFIMLTILNIKYVYFTYLWNAKYNNVVIAANWTLIWK